MWLLKCAEWRQAGGLLSVPNLCVVVVPIAAFICSYSTACVQSRTEPTPHSINFTVGWQGFQAPSCSSSFLTGVCREFCNPHSSFPAQTIAWLSAPPSLGSRGVLHPAACSFADTRPLPRWEPLPPGDP
jgi:hypothetical protein